MLSLSNILFGIIILLILVAVHVFRSGGDQRLIFLRSQERSILRLWSRLRLFFARNHYGWFGWSYFLLSFITRWLQNNVGILFLNLFLKYFRKNFFDNFEELRYPNMSYADYLGWPFNGSHIDLNLIGFSNKSIMIFDGSKKTIFKRIHKKWIERKISNLKYGQIVTLRNFTDERLN